MNSTKEGSRSYEIRKRTFTCLSLIQKNKLSSGTKIRTHQEMMIVREVIKKIPLPGNAGEPHVVNVNGQPHNVSSAFDFHTNFSVGLTAAQEHEVS